MSILTLLLSPHNILFFIIATGFAIGKLRIRNISLGGAGILFSAMVVGTVISRLITGENLEIISKTQSTINIFSKLGTSLFVSVIGLQTGFSVNKKSKESGIAMIIGALMSISGVCAMLFISLLDKTASNSSLIGILCGALTSTPGLSSACDIVGVNTEEATWGYGCSYPLGVIIIVLFTRALSPKENGGNGSTNTPCVVKNKKHIDLMLICAVSLLGNILSSITAVSFGTTANTLFVGFVIGYITKRVTKSSLISTCCLDTIKKLGMGMFLAGTGFASGIQSFDFNIKPVLYGVFITLTALISGWLVCKGVSHRGHIIHQGFVVAGGMTSTPAYSALCDSEKIKTINNFSFAYLGALISLILSIQFVGKIIC